MKQRKARQYKRILRYLFLALLPLVLLWVLITRQSREWALTITEQNAANMLDKNAELIDQRFASISRSIYLLMNDANVNELLITSNYDAPLRMQSHDRDLQNIVGQYIDNADSICSMYIVSSQYSFCFFNQSGLPSIIIPDNIAYKDAIQSAKSAVWFPTTRYKQVVRLGDRYGQYFSDFDAFSIGALMNLSYVKYGYVHNYANVDEQPIILINLYPKLFDQWLASEHLLSDTFYQVYTRNHELIYASDGLANAYTDPVMLPIMENAEPQSVYLDSAQDKSVLACSRLLRETGWTITSYTPVKSAYSYFGSNISNLSLIVFLITALLVQVVVRLTTRSISKPLDQLSDALHETAQGHYDYRITNIKHPDYQDTFHAYNSMNEHIDRLIKENYEIQLSEKNLEIQLINMQFNPHFLYNTLNIISLVAMEDGKDQISDMLCKLSYMMRYSVKMPSAKVLLAKDMEYIDAYITLMQLRTNEQFTYEKDIDPMLMKQLVPKFMLQPFVENAILHGFSKEHQHYLLRITAKAEGDILAFTVEDNGQGINQQDFETLWNKDTASIGISNTHKRIQLYYGAQYGVTIHSTPNMGTSVSVHIPWRDMSGESF